MAKAKGVQKREGVQKKTSIGISRNSRVTSKNKPATAHAKKYRGQGR